MREAAHTPCPEFSAVILAGGKSSRMGRDKAWLSLDGRPLLARQIALVRSLGPVEVFISGRADADYAPFGCPVLHDRVPGAGPLAGIAAALDVARGPLALVLAVDLPWMTSAVLLRFLARCASGTGVVPRVDGRLEPLAAVYPKAALPHAEELLRRQRRAARTFVEGCQCAGLVAVHDVDASEWPCFANWNSPEDLSRSGG